MREVLEKIETPITRGLNRIFLNLITILML